MEAENDKILGCLLGCAVGDALGLPREGLSRRRALRLLGPAPLRYHFLFGRGMVSDDTEHACLVGQALLASHGDPATFARMLARGLRGWLLSIPFGIGRATLLAILKLWLGWPPHRSGVHSAGNGPAMRAPIIGAYAADSPEQLAALVRTSTRLTHVDVRAEQGSLLIALAARQGLQHGSALDPSQVLKGLRTQVTDSELAANLDIAAAHLQRGASAEEFAWAIGLAKGVTGFINHTVPVALFCWLRYRTDFREAVERVILLGGDTDTTGAIVGGLMGATLGIRAIPQDWLGGLAEWPRSVVWMTQLSQRLACARRGCPGRALPVFWPLIPPRNLLFAAVVLLHGLRRLLPPY